MKGGLQIGRDFFFDLHPKTRPVAKRRPKPEPYVYRLFCFCGSLLRLIPEEGQSAECPCGAVARFNGSHASLEAA